MKSWIVRLMALAIAALCLWLYLSTPVGAQALLGLTFFLSLAVLSFWQDAPAQTAMAGAVAIITQMLIALFTGKIAKFGKYNHGHILLEDDPATFWALFTVYAALAAGTLAWVGYDFWRRHKAQQAVPADVARPASRAVRRG